MRHGNHRDGLLVDVDAQLHAVLVDGGEPCGDVVLHAGDVQIHAGLAAVKHFIHDCPGHDVAGGEVGAFVIALHEEFALGVREAGPFAAHGLRSAVGWNWTYSRLSRRTPARWAMAMPEPVQAAVLVVCR